MKHVSISIVALLWAGVLTSSAQAQLQSVEAQTNRPQTTPVETRPSDINPAQASLFGSISKVADQEGSHADKLVQIKTGWTGCVEAMNGRVSPDEREVGEMGCWLSAAGQAKTVYEASAANLTNFSTDLQSRHIAMKGKARQARARKIAGEKALKLVDNELEKKRENIKSILPDLPAYEDMSAQQRYAVYDLRRAYQSEDYDRQVAQARYENANMDVAYADNDADQLEALKYGILTKVGDRKLQAKALATGIEIVQLNASSGDRRHGGNMKKAMEALLSSGSDVELPVFERPKMPSKSNMPEPWAKGPMSSADLDFLKAIVSKNEVPKLENGYTGGSDAGSK